MSEILVSPLSWGLGHATRDIPIIRELMDHGHEVTIATSLGAFHLLKKECPDCEFIYFEDYPAPYSSTKYFLPKFIANIPVMAKAVSQEKKMIDKLISKNNYDAIISDNRLGVYSKKIPSFFISHQLSYSFPSYIRHAEILSQYVNEYFHKKFDRIIIPSNSPDDSGNCLSGKLCRSARKTTNMKAYYAGILSSVQKLDVPEDLDFLITISGPEPQRTILEKIVLKQVQELPGEKMVLLGRPQVNFEKKLDSRTTVKSYATEEEKALLMNRAKFIISRSGYTTMMDIAELGKKHGVFIPTPGQTEQEYLSQYYHEQKWFYSNSQYRLNLIKDIENAEGYNGFPEMPKTEENMKRLYEEVFAGYLD
ncbi:MAG: glycosyltransferase [Candidatus Methanoperedens sp.]|nr:glycosyltransferase [Candidatus Methanoperedens sp.]